MAWILAHFALSTGVEKDAIEEDKAFSHVATHTFRFQDMNILVWASFADFPLNITWTLRSVKIRHFRHNFLVNILH